MKKTNRIERTSRGSVRDKRRDTILWMLSAAFLLGAILGGWMAGRGDGTPYIANFLEMSPTDLKTAPIWRELWITLRWPLGIILLGRLPKTGITVPLLFGLRGLLLAYGIGSFITERVFKGVLWAAVLYGPTCLLSIPVMFLLGTLVMLRKIDSSIGKESALGIWIATMAALILLVFLNQSAAPYLARVFLGSTGETM